MYNPIDVVRLDAKSRNTLITLKRYTKIQNWNTLSRWGFIYSLTRPEIPNKVYPQDDGAIEMSWRVFAGSYGNLLWALLKQRVRNDGLQINDDILKDQFKRHLYRGIQDMRNLDLKSAIDLIEKTLPYEKKVEQFELDIAEL